MNNVGGVESFECAECLVDEVLGVVVGKVLRSDYTVHVSFHEFLDDCNAGVEGSVCAGRRC